MRLCWCLRQPESEHIKKLIALPVGVCHYNNSYNNDHQKNYNNDYSHNHIITWCQCPMTPQKQNFKLWFGLAIQKIAYCQLLSYPLAYWHACVSIGLEFIKHYQSLNPFIKCMWSQHKYNLNSIGSITSDQNNSFALLCWLDFRT